ncbi:MAG: hypothetical protein IJ563_08370 [Selenomonadaceae bacterium]|nr:hypothetical protein [Selenomonadaceae bacterium]
MLLSAHSERRGKYKKINLANNTNLLAQTLNKIKTAVETSNEEMTAAAVFICRRT